MEHFVSIIQESWYTSSVGTHCATGYLEDRLRNVRKRSPKYTPGTTKSMKTSEASDVPLTDDADFDGK